MTVRNPACSIGILMAAMLVAACPLSASQAPLAVVPLLPYEDRLWVAPIVIHGDTMPFLFDTGGAQTIITPSTARRLGCVPTGAATETRMTGEQVHLQHCRNVVFGLGDVEFTHDEVAVFDLASVVWSSTIEAAGLISLRSFTHHPFTMDLAGGQLILESDGSLAKRIAGAAPVESRTVVSADNRSVRVFFRMILPAPGWYLFDNANLDVVHVSAALVERVSGGQPGDIFEGPIQLDGFRSIEGQWRVSEMIYDGALSEEYLRSWVVTVDLTRNAVWAVRAASREAA